MSTSRFGKLSWIKCDGCDMTSRITLQDAEEAARDRGWFIGSVFAYCQACRIARRIPAPAPRRGSVNQYRAVGRG